MKTIYYSIFILLLFATSCANNRYITEETVAITKNHQKVAILPVEVFTTGNLPKQLSLDEIRKIELAESELFQDIVLASIQHKTKGGKTPYWVNFMSNKETTNLLKKNGISIEESYEIPPSQLAKILGVDAVIITNVKKTRYMSEETSAMISVAERAARIFTNRRFANLPRLANRTSMSILN